MLQGFSLVASSFATLSVLALGSDGLCLYFQMPLPTLFPRTPFCGATIG
jgi:hypothetical protein